RFFASNFRYIYLASVLPLIYALLRNASGESTKRLVRLFAVVHGLIAVVLLFSPGLNSLPHDFRSFVWSFIIPMPLCWIAAIDHSAFTEAGGWGRLPEQRSPRAFSIIQAALVVSLAFSVTSYLRFVTVEHAARSRGTPAMLISIAAHLLLATFVFGVLAGVREVLARIRATAVTEFVVSSALLWFTVFVILRKFVLASLALNNSSGTLFAAVASLEITLLLTGFSVCLYRTAPSDSVDAFTLPLYFLAPLFTRRALVRIVWVVACIAAAYAIPALLARSDWDSLFQRLAAVFIWVAALAFALSTSRHRPTKKRSLLKIAFPLALAAISFFAVRAVSTPRFADRFSACTRQNCLGDVVEQYAGFDESFKAIRDAFAPALDDGEHADFNRFLRQYTNIVAPVRPVDINIAGKLQPTPGAKPNIFLFVIDSLRPDYLSAYNSTVTFAPNLGSFARESDVMQKAFTRYGGTALAEPSIWSGTMQVHKQYVEPYDPMNALQKLLEFEHYDSYVTLDPLLRAILGHPTFFTELDKNTTNQNYDLCVTLKEIEQRIASRTDTSKPIFVYTQPLNVHVTGLYYAKKSRREQRSYPGFDADHASQIEIMDAAFGEFIQFLKEKGLYDNSIIIVTADHGDSIGEYGRYGHNGTPYPEILRIPLIIHVPPQLRQSLVSDPKRIAFNTDITPTLYYLLGHRDLMANEIVGRPLFVANASEFAKWDQPDYLVVSSYTAAYGILSEDASTLFIADAQTGANYFYDLSRDHDGLHNLVNAENCDKGEELIRKHIGAINRFFGL
ncbi:MAG TPA: sulfatase-like hydrolase/transferase, partial [Terriglobales bacterium]|nr:sulfatase-like hydrolase/transferase [Terriglobales bacterium]